MDDELQPESDLAPTDAHVGEAIQQEIALVLPATAYDTIDTEDDRTGPPPADLEPKPDLTPGTDSSLLPALEAMGETIHRRLDDLQTLFEREIRAEATREKVVDRLHSELQEYKQDLLLNMLRPIFVDLIQLHDDVGKMADAQLSAPRENDDARGPVLIREFQQGIEDILYRQGVEPYTQTEPAFDPRRQRAVATVPTDDPSLNKQVANRHRKGFQAGEKVIRPEIVSVYVYKA